MEKNEYPIRDIKPGMIPKHPVWSPRPTRKIISGDRPRLTVFEPRSRVVVSFDTTDPRIPFIHLSTEDDSAIFEIENNLPRFEMKIKNGKMSMNVDGISIERDGKTQTFTWKEKKEISQILTQLTMKDPIYRATGKRLGDGLRIATSLTRGIETQINLIQPSDTVVPQEGFSVAEGILPVCSPWSVGEAIAEDLLSAGQRILECTEETIETVIENCIDPIPDCLAEASRDLNACKRRCNRRYRKWNNKWMRPICKGGCYVEYAIDAAVCLGKALICTIITTVETFTRCITTSGWAPDEPTHECDILLFAADDPIGYAIDYTTCGYGYSHAALVCGNRMIHATSDGVISSPLDYYGSRKFAPVRIGLTGEQCKQLCACVQEKIGSDYDYLEAVTFGTVDDPGREICTMLIMHCLDNIGFNRETLGLGGFVSPNDIARQLGAPNANNL